MPKLKLHPVVQVDNKGNEWVSANPKTIEAALNGDGSSNLPKHFEADRRRLLEGADLESLTFREKLDRQIPLYDLGQLPYLIGFGGLATLAGYIAAHGDSSKNYFHEIHQFLANSTPKIASDIINAFNDNLLFFVKGREYDNAAVLGLLRNIGILGGLLKGVIPWRGDQIAFKKSHRKRLEEQINDGTQPYNGIGHFVGIGMKDPLLSAEMNDGTSFARALREEFGDIILIQRESPYWQPGNIGINLNDGKFYTNLSKLLVEGTPRAETFGHVIVSGAYKARGVLVNQQREHELFEVGVVDSTDREKLDFSLARNVLRNGERLRNVVYTSSPPNRVSIIIPQYFAPKESLKSKGEDSWKYTVASSFLRETDPKIDGVIIPERVFLNIVLNELKKRNKLHQSIYIDTEGEEDGNGKAYRCKEQLEKLYRSKGLPLPKIYIDAKNASDTRTSIILRKYNAHVAQSARANISAYGHDLVLIATTQRRDTMVHTGDRRVPINYKSEIARLALQHLQGTRNEYSLEEHLARGELKRQQ